MEVSIGAGVAMGERVGIGVEVAVGTGVEVSINLGVGVPAGVVGVKVGTEAIGVVLIPSITLSSWPMNPLR
jgi:hypothetical protein